MKRRPELTGEERDALLHSLTAVGPSKPVGYLPLNTIEMLLKRSPETIAAAAAARGLATAQFGPSICCIKSGALYAYDRDTLAALLKANADAVRAAGLPRDPDYFVAHIAAVWFDESHPAHRIIATAFGDSV